MGLIVRHPVAVLLLFALAVAALGWQARHFRIDASAGTLLSEDNRHYVRSQIVAQRYAPQEFLLVAFEPTAAPLLSATSFRTLAALEYGLQALERVESVRSLLNVPLFSLAPGGLDAASDPDSLTIARADFAPDEIAGALRDHPIYEGLLVNADQSATALQVLFRPNQQLETLRAELLPLLKTSLERELDASEQAERTSLQEQIAAGEAELDKSRHQEIRQIRTLIQEMDAAANFYLGGAHVLGYQLVEIIRQDLLIFGSAIAGLIILLLSLLFASWRWVLIPLLCCAASVLATLGLFGLLGLKATVISSNFVALQLILTLAIVIHLIVQYRETRRQQPDAGQPELVAETMRRKILPCLYAGLTTSVGFAALLLSGIAPVVSFGGMMMVAMAVSLLVSLILFPALMALFGREPVAAEPRLSGRLLQAMVRAAQRRGRVIGLVSIGLLIASGVGLLWLDVENSFINYFRDSTQVHQELAFIDRELGGTTALDLTYRIPPADRQDDLVLTAATVQHMQRIQKALEEKTGMGKMLSVVNFTELARALNDDRPLTEYELTALYRTLEAPLREDLLGSFFSPDHQELRLSARIIDTTPGLDRGALLTSLRQDLAALGVAPENYTLSNLFVLYQDLLQRLYRSQILTLGVVYLALALAFALIFRSFRLALLAITPNILATLAILGLMGWTGIALDFMTITIAAIAMGIAVDDTIHYVHRYREELGGARPGEALASSHASVGAAILYTSGIIALGFALLGFSDFVPSVLFGLLTALAMLLALLANLLLLPVLLVRFYAAAEE